MDHIKARLSLQMALLQHIPAQVRRVDAYWSDSRINIRFVIDGEPIEELSEIAHFVETEVHADFAELDDVVVKLERIDYPNVIVSDIDYPRGGAVVFERYEREG